MSECAIKGKSIGGMLFDYLQRNPHDYDVTFLVGPEKKPVKAVRMVLKAGSSVLETEFKEKWDNAIVKEGGGIPLPELDPTAFQLFVNLLIQDTWSVESIKSLTVPADTLFSLLVICRRFGVTKALKSLTELTSEFILTFNLVESDEKFLKLSRTNLETVLSSDHLPLPETEIFHAACRWAENHCKEAGQEATIENIREALGDCLYQIRFPTMNVFEFTKLSKAKNLLTDKEKLSIYEFMGTEGQDRGEIGGNKLLFEVQNRIPVLLLKEALNATQSANYKCSGSINNNCFQVNRKIALKGIEFFGPTNTDSQYDVTVEIKRLLNGSWAYASGEMKKQIYGKKGETLLYLFEHPIHIEPSMDASWSTRYDVLFRLKGSETSQLTNSSNAKKFVTAGTEFFLLNWDNGKPISKLHFVNI